MNRLNSLALFILLLSALFYGIIEWQSQSFEQDNVSTERQKPDFVAEKLQSNIYSDKVEIRQKVKLGSVSNFLQI